MGYSPGGCKESDTTERLHFLSFFLSFFLSIEVKLFPYNFFLGLLLFSGAKQIKVILLSLCKDNFHVLCGCLVRVKLPLFVPYSLRFWILLSYLQTASILPMLFLKFECQN